MSIHPHEPAETGIDKMDDWPQIMELAAWGLVRTPAGITGVFSRHRRLPDGTCSECGQRWRCRLGRIAVAAQMLNTATKHPALRLATINGVRVPHTGADG